MPARTTLPALSTEGAQPVPEPQESRPVPKARELQPAPAGRVLQPTPESRAVSEVAAAGPPATAEELPRRSRWRSAVRWLLLLVAVLGGAAGAYFWQRFSKPALPPGIIASNGRLEATEIDIATKLAGRIETVLVQEGDFVERGQIVARMDTSVLQAQLREARADLARAKMAAATAAAVVEQKRSELSLAQSVLRRSEQLVQGHFISTEKLDTDRAQVNVASAALNAANSQVAEAKSAIAAASATIERIQADIEDSVLRAPADGRAQYRLAQPGEVLPPGGKVIGMLNLTDVYMTLFLPEDRAGRLAIGAEARLIFDAAPQYVVPARISFVATEAQFTPKTVETATERQKLVYRVKAQLDPQLLRAHWAQVKAGVPGTGYVRVDSTAAWPDTLAIRLPVQ